MQARHNLPVTGNTIQDEKRRQDRTRHFLGTDPAGSWVAEDDGTVVGHVAVLRARGVLDAVPAGHRARPPGSRRGPRAAPLGPLARRRSGAGDDPVLARPQGDGALRRLRLHVAPGRRRLGSDAPGRGGPAGRGRRATNRTRSGRPSSRRWTASTEPCAGRRAPWTSLPCSSNRATGCSSAAKKGTRWPRTTASSPSAPATRSPPSSSCARCWPSRRPARRSRSTGSPRPSNGPSARWCAAGIELQPFGPVMVRGMAGPPCPYLPSGGFG